MPSAEDDEILYSPRELKKPRVEDRYIRTDAQIEKLLAQETRRRWRVLAAYLKALVVGVEENVLTWEEALLPYALLETGKTVAEEMLPRMAEAIESGRLSVQLLPALGETGNAQSRSRQADDRLGALRERFDVPPLWGTSTCARRADGGSDWPGAHRESCRGQVL